MSKNLFDDQSIEIPCPGCGQKAKKTIAWLRDNANYVCAGCGETIAPDAEKLFKGLRDAENKLRDTFAGIGKKHR